MINREVTIINKLGLHARAASKFVILASSFNSDIKLVKNSKSVSGKSIMGIMMLAANKGTRLELQVSGDDEQEAAYKLIELINQRFGESE